MKKKLLSLACIGFLAFVGIFTVGCGDNGPEAVETVQANNLPSYYHVTDTVSFDEVTLDVTYDNEEAATLTVKEVDVPVEEAQENTQFILYTDGLSAMTGGALTVGTYTITCAVVGFDGEWTLGNIEVSDNQNLIYDVASFLEPQFVTTYKTNISSTTHEDAFYNTTEAYTVGDDNAFKFKPDVTYILKSSGSISIVVPDDFNVNVRVYLIDGSSRAEVTGDENYYTYSNFEFDFTEQAVGNTFEIVMTMTDFTTAADGAEISPVTFTFKVEDGWNAYDALDLARINLTDVDATGYARATSQAIFPGSSGYEERSFYLLWEEYLQEKFGTELSAVNGIYFHDNIEVTPSDLPEEFFVSSTESSYAAGSLRDYSFLYSHLLDDDFVVNGNYFMLDLTDIPVGLSNTRKTGFVYDSLNDHEAGHSTVFAFSGLLDNTSTHSATIKNLNTIGNTGNILSAGEGVDENQLLTASGGLILVKSMHGTTYVDNCIAKEFLIAWYPESTQFNDVGNMHLDYVKTYDCFNSALFAFASDNITIENSEFKRFGGPAIFLVSDADGKQDDMETNEGVRYAGVTIDDNTVIESYVTGNEAWFAMQGDVAASIVTRLMQMDYAFSFYQNTMVYEREVNGETNDYLNLICLIMDQGYLASQETLYGDFLWGAESQTNVAFSTYSQTVNTALAAGQYQAPVLMTNAGDVSVFNGTGLTFVNDAGTANHLDGNLLFMVYPIGGQVNHVGAVLGLETIQAA